MPSAADLTQENRFVAMFIGPSKEGKTVAACSFPGPIKVMDFDGRIRGILGAPWIDRSQISYEYYPPKDPNLIDKVNKDLESMQTLASVNQLNIKTLVLDSLTSECFAMVQQALKFTHSKGSGAESKGKYYGVLAATGPEDYNFEAQSTYSIMSFLRSLPIPNIIVSAHVVDKYGKPPGSDNKYADSVIVGEKLSVRDKIGENVKIYFDHTFRFTKQMQGDKERYFVRFRGSLENTSYVDLPEGDHDITGKSFYEFMMSNIKKKEVVPMVRP